MNFNIFGRLNEGKFFGTSRSSETAAGVPQVVVLKKMEIKEHKEDDEGALSTPAQEILSPEYKLGITEKPSFRALDRHDRWQAVQGIVRNHNQLN